MNEATIQRFAGHWQSIASVELRGDPARGIGTPTVTAYLLDYAIEHLDRRDACALSCSLPVMLDAQPRPRWPAFLVDLVPQGHGRRELLREMDLPETTAEPADWALLLRGAGNPIGNLRVGEAHEWLLARTPPEALRGFTREAVASREEHFLEYLSSHGLYLAGSSGVQGEWPKILLAQAEDGLFYLDHTLPDDKARAHWLVKFGREKDSQLDRILALEAPYMRLAQHLGLRVHADLALHGRALFVPRFDRRRGPGGLERIAQESVASLCELAQFGAAPSHNTVIARLAEVATDPEGEIIEYVRRDIANIVLGNKDNHARNTALARHADGRIELTPLFDFAPMLLHPEGIARRTRWEKDDAGQPRWASVIEQCRKASTLPLPGLPAALCAMAPALEALPNIARELGVDNDLLARLNPLIDDAARQLQKI